MYNNKISDCLGLDEGDGVGLKEVNRKNEVASTTTAEFSFITAPMLFVSYVIRMS